MTIALQAITTTFLGPTPARPARIIAKAQAGRVILPWDHGLDVWENHQRAAKAFVEKFGWFGVWATGANYDGSRVHVCVSRGTDANAPQQSTWHAFG